MALQETVTMPLAVHDFLPVALAATATALVARRIRGPSACLGAAMVAAGGVLKATWKLLVAADVADWPRLADALFPLLGAGFVLLALAAWGYRSSTGVAATAAAAGLGLAVPALAGLYLPVAVLGVTALYVALLRDANRAGDRVAVALLAPSLLFTYLLGPLAAGEQSLGMQWIEQSVNSLNQGAFALAAWRLTRIARVPACADGSGGRVA